MIMIIMIMIMIIIMIIIIVIVIININTIKGNHVIHIETCPLFKNEIIDRELSLTDRNTIINHIITNGNILYHQY